MSRVLAIDPGPTESAYALIDHYRLLMFEKCRNDRMLDLLYGLHDLHRPNVLAVEMIASYGMPVGAEVFETCRWVGRFEQQWVRAGGGLVRTVYRKQVAVHLCNSVRAKDANVRQALIDRFGGKGTKAAPGPFYGVSGDVWAAIAVAVFVADTLGGEQ